jgi:peroxiredoxin
MLQALKMMALNTMVPSKAAGRAGLVAGLAVAVSVGLSTSALSDIAIGAPPPALKARDINGAEIALSDFKGKTVVIEWTNPECPYVKKHYTTNNMQSLQKDATAAGAVWLMVSSAAPGKNGYVNELEAASWLESQKAKPTAFLQDPTGTIADAYGVKLALHMFVVAPDGRLAYAGAIDDKPTSKPDDVKGARNYVRDALAAVASGKAMQPAMTRPYGCYAR